ncbi:TPA: 23S rRNA methyltransferase attenuation leader peptide [Enterococcus faecalis]|nr:23S rRNA methyltransferase attenuation leader peptide [Enterococcus faecalis]
MLVFQMRNVDKTSTVLKQTKNSDYDVITSGVIT